MRTIYVLATPEPSANGNPVPLTTCTLRCAMEPTCGHFLRRRCAWMAPAPALAAAAEPAAGAPLAAAVQPSTRKR